jgi:UDP-N-acetylglucosamine--N-acetylmuramyl-(pentapeptide) pyrophosphoryl-undecaprenol N-acetylglucosamine transferase
MPVVLIAGGGTGGHIFPAVAVARELRARGFEVVMVGAERGLETQIVPAEGLPLLTIPVAGLKGKGILGAALGALMLPGALAASWRIVASRRPRAVVGVGGYASGPVVAAALARRVPTLIHEQNLIPGATNRWLAPFVREVAVTFEETRARLGGRGVVTGNPVRSEFASVPPRPRGRAERRLLIFGGSQGAAAINGAVAAALPGLAPLRGRLRIVHQTGGAGAAAAREAYARAGFEAEVLPFIGRMAAAMAEADLVVARAGATTVAELTAAGRGSVLIPLPTAVHDHQTLNARTLERAGAAVVLPQPGLTGESLAAALAALLGDEERLDAMAAAARRLGRPDAAARIADLVGALAGPGAGGGAR